MILRADADGDGGRGHDEEPLSVGPLSLISCGNRSSGVTPTAQLLRARVEEILVLEPLRTRNVTRWVKVRGLQVSVSA